MLAGTGVVVRAPLGCPVCGSPVVTNLGSGLASVAVDGLADDVCMASVLRRLLKQVQGNPSQILVHYVLSEVVPGLVEVEVAVPRLSPASW